MKNLLLYFLLTVLVAGCYNQPTRTEMVNNYYDAFNASDFNQLLPLIGDTLTIAEGEYMTSYTHESFREHFKWDSIFQPTYEIVNLEEQDKEIIATVASTSVRYEFLKNNPLTYRFKFSFMSGKIVKIDAIEPINADWNIWEAERDSLVSWIKEHHPELDGFIHDLSMQGAINYLKAIELYESKVD